MKELISTTKNEILALPAGRELDILVTEMLTGQSRLHCRFDPMAQNGEPQFYFGYPAGHDFAPAYSTDIAAAWQVVENLRESLDVWVRIYDKFCVCEIFCHVPNRMTSVGRASEMTAPEAICKAALLARLGGAQ